LDFVTNKVLRLKKIRICLFLSLGIFHSLFCQTYPFVNYTNENGLSGAQVLSIYQDKEGVMWFGTSGGGITRFDGKHFEYLTSNDGLADNVVFCMKENKLEHLYIGTYNGLTVIKNATRLNKNEIINYTTKDGLSDNCVYSVLFHNNNTYLATGRGITIYNGQRFEKLKIHPKLDTANVYNISIDKNGFFWYSTLGDGVFYDTGKSIINLTEQDNIKNNMVFDVYHKNKTQNLILNGEGLDLCERNKICSALSPLTPTSTSYQCYLEDNKNNLWFGTNIGLLKTKNDSSILLFKKENGIVDNSIWKLFIDKEHNLWAASEQAGVSRLNSERFYSYTSADGLTGKFFRCVFETSTGQKIVGSKAGITYFNKNKSLIKAYSVNELHANSDIYTIAEDNNGTLYFGTANGLLVNNNGQFKRYICRDKNNPYNAIFSVHIDNKNVVWLGTQAGIAKLINGFIEPMPQLNVCKNFIYKITQENDSTIWFATEDGLFKLQNNSVKKYAQKDGLPDSRVHCIGLDHTGSLWASSGNNLYKKKGDRFVNITLRNNLPNYDVNAITFEKNGVVWAGLDVGLVKLIPYKGEYKVRYYSVEDGFPATECSLNGMIFDKNGLLNIATTRGLVIYQPEFDKDNLFEPFLKLRSIDLFYQETDWSVYSDSVNGQIPFNLSLPYDKNYLTFNFVGISHTTPEKVNYKFILKGFESEWRFSFKTEASYSNIPPGNYEFILYSNNGEGVWNKHPLVFSFSINPPFWRTWWFYSIILLIILSGVYSYIKISNANRKILKQNEIIEEKNDALQHANIEIAEINRNITDSINYAKRIQQSFISSDDRMKKLLADYFVLFKPRDIVSGDFYMAFDLPDRVVMVCADCTGHGIPGAFMSLIGISVLNEIARSQKPWDSNKIVEHMRDVIIGALNPEKIESGGKDGMDLSLISVFKKSENGEIKIQFSGGNSSVQHFSTTNNQTQIIEYRGDKQPVGYYSNMKPFTLQEIYAKPGDIFYMFTDGYADQFGGTRGKKFMSRQLKQLLSSITHLPMNEQKSKLDFAFETWKGNLEQVDDVTIMGVKI